MAGLLHQSLVAAAALVVLGAVLAAGRRARLAGHPGWRQVAGGCLLLAAGTGVELLAVAEPEILSGDAVTWLRSITLFSGFCLLGAGLVRWIPALAGGSDADHAFHAFREVAGRLGAVFWVASPAPGRIDWIGPAFRAVWERSPQPFLTAPARLLETVHPADRAMVRRALERLRGRGWDQAGELAFRILRPHGEVRWLRVRYAPVHDAAGHVLQLVGVVEDLTDRREMDDRRQAEAQAQRDTLVREVHHRIKNHLQGLVGLLRSSGRGHGSECQAALDAAAGRVHAIAVVHGLQSADGAEEVAVCHLVEAICRGMELVAPERPVEVLVAVRDGPARLDPAEAVPVALVIQELVFNAVKHAAGEGAIRVRVEGSRERVRIRITNPGRLIPAVDLAGADRAAGTGLGLVRSLLAPRGAELHFDTGEGRVEATLGLRPPVLVVA